MITTQIDTDIKRAMLDRNQLKTDTLKGIKTALQYARVAKGSDLDEEQVTGILQKELKKRKEAADLYLKAGSSDKHKKELEEASIIKKYLPPEMSESDIEKLVDEIVSENSTANMGQIIGLVKARSGGAAEGSLIAKIVQTKLK